MVHGAGYRGRVVHSELVRQKGVKADGFYHLKPLDVTLASEDDATLTLPQQHL